MTRRGKIRAAAWSGLALLLLAAPFFFCSARSRPENRLSIVYSGRINGQIDPCG